MKIGMAANLTGGEAEELHKATGGKRSDAILVRMRSRLIDGMTANGIGLEAQAEILCILSTVREFMFPESHAHSFASLAYSSAYARHYYRTAYTCAMLNNQSVLRHSRAATTTDVYMQEIPASVQSTINSINRELRKSSGSHRPSRKQSAATGITVSGRHRASKPLTQNDTKSWRGGSQPLPASA